MISVKENRALCCGCSACVHVCPAKCITMEPDSEGFLYPAVKKSLCVACGRCDAVCPVRKSAPAVPGDSGYPVAYGGFHKDEHVRRDSSSGGAFTLLAREILRRGGIVYGCALDETMRAVHVGVEKESDLAGLRGSKYVQSDTGDCYAEIRDWLKKGRAVLFTGTPCQAAGLFSFLGDRKPENLYVVDFICHGVPSPLIFREYIKRTEKKHGDKIVSYKFRNKDHGWHESGLQLGTEAKFENGKHIRRYPAFRDTFMNGFLDNLYLRPSCHACAFKCLPKGYADFTVADFWGVNGVDSALNDGKGTSLILLHNRHAADLWESVGKDFYYERVDLEKAVKRNKILICSSSENPDREKFFDDYLKKGFAFVERKYMSAFRWAWHKIRRIS